MPLPPLRSLRLPGNTTGSSAPRSERMELLVSVMPASRTGSSLETRVTERIVAPELSPRGKKRVAPLKERMEED